MERHDLRVKTDTTDATKEFPCRVECTCGWWAQVAIDKVLSAWTGHLTRG